jgi:hypothetical protein
VARSQQAVCEAGYYHQGLGTATPPEACF